MECFLVEGDESGLVNCSGSEPTDYVSMGLFWLTLALINAGLAEQKGRSRWNWFLLSLLLGPIATFCIVAWARPDAPPGPSFGATRERYREARVAEKERKAQS